MNLRRVLAIVRKELIQLRRDPQLLRIMIISPIFQLIVFGYAVTTDVRHVSLALLDLDRTSESRELAARFYDSGWFDRAGDLGDPAEIDRLMDRGAAQAVLQIPRGFGRDRSRGRTADVQVILDGADSMTAGIIAGYTGSVIREYSGRVAAERLDRMRSRIDRVPAVEERLRVWYNPELKSVNYMVPGVFCMIIFLVTMLLTSLAIVKEREIGTLEQLVVTPITGRELILGKTIPYILVGLLDMLLVLATAILWFKVSVAGSIPLLIALGIVFMLTSLGFGLFISTISETQQQAMMVTFFFMLPSILLSGFMFPIANMPAFIRPITYAIPLRYFLVVVRGIFLKGNGMAELWPQVAALAVYGSAVMGLASLRFRKRLG
jgi:ABC-2 type transport system permease protein